MRPDASQDPFKKARLVPSEIAFALLTRGTQGAVMLVAMLGIPQFLSHQEQGLFFVFISLGALLQLGEFGLAYATLQIASHLAAVDDLTQLAQLRHQARRLNLTLLTAATLIVGCLGLLLFYRGSDMRENGVHWVAPWLAFIVTVFVTQLVNLEITLIEGSSSASAAWRIRLTQEILAGLIFIAALFGGAGLWSLSAYWAMRSVVAASWTYARRLRRREMPDKTTGVFDWRTDAWPFQWRIGLSALSGFLIFQAINPIVLIEKGAIVAGQFGMSLAMMNMVLLVTSAWPLSQASRYGRLIGLQRFAEVRRIFWRVTVSSTLFAASAALALLFLLQLLAAYEMPFAMRTAGTISTAALLATGVAHHIVQCFAALLRAERREPLLTVSVLGGLLNVTAVWIAAHLSSPHAIAFASLGCALIGIPLAAMYYRRSSMRWLATETHASEFSS